MPQPDEITINSAVQRCVNAWREALARKNCKDPIDPGVWERDYAGKAYRKALPWLSTPDNVDAFIACVAQGLAIGAIDPSHATKLLYAAQIAITSRRARLHAEKEARTQKQDRAKKEESTPTPSPLTTNGVLGTKGGEAAVAAPQVPAPQAPPSPAPSSALNNLQPQKPKPAPKAPSPKDDLTEHVQVMLERILAGKPIDQVPLTPWKKTPPPPQAHTR
ncbi:hypothetical protein [Occallatibacter riparius]|uniref:Uncharacterized protein n=1 Tax=Occallatibacter riparius TaxID=1002689 RepID=A0A9J7BSG3_9BACT|nr:hypothetical protein [Occallatibacter riparius]UWZ85600.1 hypothetical protein MOP44_06560 [Occallatibacter riparius]